MKNNKAKRVEFYKILASITGFISEKKSLQEKIKALERQSEIFDNEINQLIEKMETISNELANQEEDFFSQNELSKQPKL